MSVYRFLCGHNGQSLLHDPSLHRVVYDLMGRLFSKFIGELKRLGVKVVYADFYRIIIHTNKYDLDSAHEYLKFITTAITNKDLFKFLQVRTKKVWEQLLWLSPVNYSGIPAAMAEEENDADESNVELVDQHDSLIKGTNNDVFPVASSNNKSKATDKKNNFISKGNLVQFSLQNISTNLFSSE